MNESRRHLMYICIAVLLLAVAAMQLFAVRDEYRVGMLLCVLALIAVRPLPFREWSWTDGALGVIVAFEIVSCCYAACTVPALQGAVQAVYCFSVYLLLRRILISSRVRNVLLWGSVLPVSVALLLAIGSFVIFRNAVLSAGFPDTYHFRFLFRPLGYITNVWAEVLLVLLGWVCLLRRYSMIFTFAVLLAILLSFSRGAYIALGVYLLFWLVASIPWHEKLKLYVSALAAMAIVIVCLPEEMKTTLKMNVTASQRQSTQWRIDTTHSAWQTIKERPLWGWGGGNYTYAADRVLNQDSTLPYTSFAPNICTQLLVEKGMAGTLLYLFLLAGIGVTLWKRRKSPQAWIVLCTLSALAVKEMTQAVWTSNSFIQLMCFMMLALLQSGDDSRTEKTNERGGIVLPGVALVVYIAALVHGWISLRDEDFGRRSFQALEEGDFGRAEEYMEQTSCRTACLIKRGILYADCFRKTGLDRYARQAEQALADAYERMPGDMQIVCLQARLQLSKGCTSQAYATLERLAANYPKNSFYLWSWAEACRQMGDEARSLYAEAEAVRYTPRLLTMSQMKRERRSGSARFRRLEQLLLSDTVRCVTPADYARRGYLLYACGRKAEAEPMLRKAVTELPNLTTPWHLLGDEKKYRLLLFGAFHKSLQETDIPQTQEFTDRLLLKQLYAGKFQNWYGADFP